jgi:hypothetical protein
VRPLQIVLWKWAQPGSKRVYESEHVNIMCLMLRRGLPNFPHRIVCVTDDEAGIRECETRPLWDDFHDLANASGRHLPSCYRRLKIYDPETQAALGIHRGERVLSIDIDTIITGDIRAVVSTPGRFVGWELKNHNGHRVFNGSFQMFTAGDHADIWSEFKRDPIVARDTAAKRGFRGSDQAWITHKTIDDKESVGLKWPAVSSYPLQNVIQGILRPDNRIIFFHGSKKPWDPEARHATPWINRYWRT